MKWTVFGAGAYGRWEVTERAIRLRSVDYCGGRMRPMDILRGWPEDGWLGPTLWMAFDDAGWPGAAIAPGLSGSVPASDTGRRRAAIAWSLSGRSN